MPVTEVEREVICYDCEIVVIECSGEVHSSCSTHLDEPFHYVVRLCPLHKSVRFVLEGDE